MPVIVLASSKGGTGKTTLAAALAVEARRRGRRVALVDADPQQSLARWHAMRESQVGDTSLQLVTASEPAGITRNAWVLVDTPSAMLEKIEDAVVLADLVVVPVRPSMLDVDAARPVIELCRRHERPFVFVLTQTFASSRMTSGARSFLADSADVLDGEIASDARHAQAMLEGSTAAEQEPDEAPAHEIELLMNEIERRMQSKHRTRAVGRRS